MTLTRPNRFLLLAIQASLMILPLAAQNTSPLDTAPGGTAAAPVPQPPAEPSQSASLLSNPDFESGVDWPEGWPKGDGISWEKENGMHFLRLVQKTPGKMQMLYREMDIPEGLRGLKITARYRTAGVVPGVQNWMDARAIFHFIDAKRENVMPDPGVIGFAPNASTWTEASLKCVVANGAARLVVMPALFMAREGTLDLAEVRVDPLTDAEVDAMQSTQTAQEKKASDRAAILAAELAMPSITRPLKVSGNKLVTADGKELWLQGVNVVPLDWSANGEGQVPWSIHVAIDDWHANVIRLPVSDGFWFGKVINGNSNDPDAYRKIVDEAIKLASVKGAYVILDLHRFFTPDQSCVDFWKDAAARYKNNPAVLFDIFNEPTGTTWDVWQKGGSIDVKQKDGSTLTVNGVGMQGLIDAVRSTGAKNIIVAGGLDYAYTLTGVMNGHALDDKGGNGIMYATHFYNWHRDWAKHFMGLAAKYPILVGETGGDIHKMNFIPAADQEDPNTWAPDAIGFIQKNHLNWTAWSFHTSATPDLLLNMDDYIPTPYWGEYVKEALAGKQFQVKRER